MATRRKGSLPALGLVLWMFSIPSSFFAGVLTGLVAPLAAIAAIVAGVRFFTGKVPFITRVEKTDDESDGQLAVRLVPTDEAEQLFSEQKEQFGREFAGMKAEIQALMEEGKAGPQAAPVAGSLD